MSQILDYSAGFPGAQAIAEAGYDGAARYTGFPGSPKCVTAGELTDFDTHERGMALVFEQGAGNWRKGYNQGIVDGRRARNHATAVGFPDTRPIYMATDQDVVTTGEFATMIEYLKGAGTQLGGAHLTGVYGEADVIDRARDSGEAFWFWQTAAWSRGRRTEAHLYQHVGTVHVGGIACDVNDVLADDWGQHNAKGGLIVATQQEIDAIATAAAQKTWEHLLPFSAPDGNTYNYPAADELLYTNWYSNMIPGLVQAFSALASALTGGALTPDAFAAVIDKAVREATQDAIEQTVLPQVRAVVLAALGTDATAQAEAIVTALAAHLSNRPAPPPLLLPAAHLTRQATAALTTQEGTDTP